MKQNRQPRLPQGLLLSVLIVALLTLLPTHPAFAVGPTGKILGTVADSTGAATPGANVTVTNQNTGETRSVLTDDSGNYSFPVLPIGNYTLKVEKDGYQTYSQTGIVLQVDQNISVPVTLSVGSVHEVVEVNAVFNTLNLADATVSNVVDQQRIVDLPLNGRDSLQLQYIMPGVTYDNDGVAHGQGQHEGVVVNGNRPGSNYYLLDGVDLTDSYLSVAPTFPAPDALQEFDIQTSNFGAQYGRSSGGLINAATKSGTNQWHGDAFEFFRNTVLNASNYFAPANEPKPSFKLNQFGGTIGGPIIKDKTFVFGYYQGTRQRRDETVTIGTVLTPAQRPDLSADGSANFSGVCPGASCPIDPRTGAAFPNDTIPANRMDPTALNFIKALMPLPNVGVAGYSFNAPSAPSLDNLNENQFLARVDQNFNHSNTLFGRYYFNQDSATGLGFDNIPNLLHQKYFRNQNIALDYTHTFTPNLLNTAVFGFTRLAHNRAPTVSVGWETFGGPATTSTGNVKSDLYTNVNGSVNGGGDGSFVQNRQTWQYTDYVSLVKGKSTMDFGTDFRKESVNRVEDYYTDPVFNFTGQYTDNSLSDLLLGLTSYFNLQTEVASRLRHSAFDLYADESYKVASNFTANIGLRWEPFLPPVDNLNDQVCFDPTFTQKSAFYPTAPPGILFPGAPHGYSQYGNGDSGCSRQLIPTRWKNFAPRVGLNWDPTKKGAMSIHAGFGIFWDQARLIGYNRFSTSTPFDQSVIVNTPGSPANNFAPSLTGESAYLNSGITDPYAPPGSPLVPRTAAERAAYSPAFGGNWPTSALEDVLAPNYNEGYTNQWNLTWQQQFATNYTFTIGYIGNHATKLWFSREYNYAPLASYNYAETLNENQSTLPVRRRLSSIQCNTAISGVAGPCYGPFEEEDPAGYSNYHSLQGTINAHFRGGSTILASYVFGKYLDLFSYGAEGGSGPRDPENFRLNYGPSDMDVRNRFVASYIWIIPKMKRFTGISNQLINNWQVQGIVTAQSGAPYSINSNTQTAANGVGGDTADSVPGQQPRVSNPNVHEYFNTAAFQNAAPGTVGDTGRNFLTGPNLVNVDFSLFKNFPINERLGTIQFRSEFFNLFNHPNFYNPDNTVGDGTFGQILSARDPRFVQFALKWLF